MPSALHSSSHSNFSVPFAGSWYSFGMTFSIFFGSWTWRYSYSLSLYLFGRINIRMGNMTGKMILTLRNNELSQWTLLSGPSLSHLEAWGLCSACCSPGLPLLRRDFVMEGSWSGAHNLPLPCRVLTWRNMHETLCPSSKSLELDCLYLSEEREGQVPCSCVSFEAS